MIEVFALLGHGYLSLFTPITINIIALYILFQIAICRKVLELTLISPEVKGIKITIFQPHSTYTFTGHFASQIPYLIL